MPVEVGPQLPADVLDQMGFEAGREKIQRDLQARERGIEQAEGSKRVVTAGDQHVVDEELERPEHACGGKRCQNDKNAGEKGPPAETQSVRNEAAEEDWERRRASNVGR